MRTTRTSNHYVRHSFHLLLVLLMWGCDSQGTSRDAFPADTSASDAQRETDSYVRDAPTEGDDAAPDGQPDAATGPDSVGVFACTFPLVSPTPLFCPNDQYCVSLGGGAMGSETTYSCAVPPSACVGKLTCECLCGTGGPGNCSPSGGGPHCQCIANPDGLSLLCAAP